MTRKNRFRSVLFVLISMSLIASTCYASESATRQEVLDKVQAAIQMVQDKGLEATLQEVANKKGQFVWKDSYVFALKADNAETVSHPMKPNLVGKNLLHVKDKNGVMLFAEFAKIGNSESGKGWVDYVWPKPGEKTPSAKHSYIEKVPGENIVFGAGYHD